MQRRLGSELLRTLGQGMVGAGKRDGMYGAGPGNMREESRHASQEDPRGQRPLGLLGWVRLKGRFQGPLSHCLSPPARPAGHYQDESPGDASGARPWTLIEFSECS